VIFILYTPSLDACTTPRELRTSFRTDNNLALSSSFNG
jgi:hypothetical protein